LVGKKRGKKRKEEKKERNVNPRMARWCPSSVSSADLAMSFTSMPRKAPAALSSSDLEEKKNRKMKRKKNKDLE